MLNASQKRMKRAALRLALMSSTPAMNLGWLATMPTDWPLKRAKQVMMFLAYPGADSKYSPLSTIARMTSAMS